MDPLTHYLSSKLTLNLFIKDENKRYISLFLLAGVFPDADYITRIWGMAAYLKYHRGITHSFLGIALLSLFLAYLFSRKEKPSFKRMFALAYFSMLLHIMLDWTNSYGTQLFLPFSDRRAALDAVFIIDIYILAIFVIALITILIFKKKRFVLTLVFTTITVTYIMTKVVFNLMVVSRIEKIPVPGGKISVAAFPAIFAINGFKCVIETHERYYTFPYYLFRDRLKDRLAIMTVLKNNANAVRPFSMIQTMYGMTVYEKFPGNEYTDLASGTYLGKVILGFARYPHYSVERLDSNTLVKIKDIRYQYRKGREGFTAKFLITDDMKIIKESFRF